MANLPRPKCGSATARCRSTTKSAVRPQSSTGSSVGTLAVYVGWLSIGLLVDQRECTCQRPIRTPQLDEWGKELEVSSRRKGTEIREAFYYRYAVTKKELMCV